MDQTSILGTVVQATCFHQSCSGVVGEAQRVLVVMADCDIARGREDDE